MNENLKLNQRMILKRAWVWNNPKSETVLCQPIEWQTIDRCGTYNTFLLTMHTAAVKCSPVPYDSGAAGFGIRFTGKLVRAWMGAWVCAWVDRGVYTTIHPCTACLSTKSQIPLHRYHTEWYMILLLHFLFFCSGLLHIIKPWNQFPCSYQK